MRPEGYPSRAHEGTGPLPDDHHPKPRQYPFQNTTQSLPPGTTYDLDVALDHANFVRAIITMYGPAPGGGGSSLWGEPAIVTAYTDAARAMGSSARTGGFKQVYAAEYSKAAGDSYLTQKIFDSNTSSSAEYICLQDAWITGAVLRLRFFNAYGGSAFLWVKGNAVLT